MHITVLKKHFFKGSTLGKTIAFNLNITASTFHHELLGPTVSNVLQSVLLNVIHWTEESICAPCSFIKTP